MSDDEIILADLSDEELVQQMHDDLYDGLKEEIEEGTNILLERGWAPYDVLTQALVEGMRIVGVDFRDGILFVPEVLMSANSKVSKTVAELSGKGIVFAACANTMRLRNVMKEDLLSQAVVVPSAVIELSMKQEEGWSYFKGGK